MKMRHFSVSALVVASLCVASVAMADLARVNVVMDISNPDNVTITNYEENGTYGGQYFGIDALEFQGAVADIDLNHLGIGLPVVPDLSFTLLTADGTTISMMGDSTNWLEYGRQYILNGTLAGGYYYSVGPLVVSSNPDDFYAVYGDDIYPRSFLIADADQQNGLGGPIFLGTIVPEPASMSLLAVGALAIIRRRRS